MAKITGLSEPQQNDEAVNLGYLLNEKKQGPYVTFTPHVGETESCEYGRLVLFNNKLLWYKPLFSNRKDKADNVLYFTSTYASVEDDSPSTLTDVIAEYCRRNNVSPVNTRSSLTCYGNGAWRTSRGELFRFFVEVTLDYISNKLGYSSGISEIYGMVNDSSTSPQYVLQNFTLELNPKPSSFYNDFIK